MPSGDEIRDIRAAYVLAAPEAIRKHRDFNAELIRNVIEFANAAADYDQDFYREHLAAIRIALVRAGCTEAEMGGETGASEPDSLSA